MSDALRFKWNMRRVEMVVEQISPLLRSLLLTSVKRTGVKSIAELTGLKLDCHQVTDCIVAGLLTTADMCNLWRTGTTDSTILDLPITFWQTSEFVSPCVPQADGYSLCEDGL